MADYPLIEQMPVREHLLEILSYLRETNQALIGARESLNGVIPDSDARSEMAEPYIRELLNLIRTEAQDARAHASILRGELSQPANKCEEVIREAWLDKKVKQY